MHTAASQPIPASEAAYRANNIGVALLEQFRYEEAVASFREALKLAQTLGLVRANLAIALLNLPRLEEARKEASAAAGMLPAAPQPPYVLGLAARGLGAVDEAKAAFRRVLALDPADVGAHVNLGQLLMQERQYAEAVAEFQAASTAEPYSATAAYNLGLALARAGQAEQSAEAMERFRQLREAAYATTLGQSYPDQGRYAEAISSSGAEPELVDRATPPVTFVDITAKLLGGGERQPKGGGSGQVALGDLDADGRLDLLVVGADGQHLYLNRPGRFVDATGDWGLTTTAGGVGALIADADNDGKPDVLVLRPSGVSLLHNEGSRLLDRTAAAGLVMEGAFVTGAFVDADHDGDLDLVLAGASGRRLLQNDGSGRFTDVTAAAGLPAGGAALALVPTDFDNRRDVDLLFARGGAPPELFRNRRDGTFRDVAADVGLGTVPGSRCLAAGDLNKDSFTDFFFGRENDPGVVVLSDGRGGFALEPGPMGRVAGSLGALRALVLDYDNDGLLDLLTIGAGGPRLFRNLGTDWSDVTASAFGPRSGEWRGEEAVAGLAAADLDDDGDTDLVLRLTSGALRILDNQGGRNHSLAVRLSGLVSNRSGVGAKVELRAGSLRQKLETYATTPAPAPADLLFGLGPREGADAVRVLWPSGVLQSELVTPAGKEKMAVLAVKELDRKPSSCPYLYAWNGRRFEFVTDFLGGGEMGYWEGPGQFNHPDPDEYVRIRSDQLVPRSGRYELRVTNELEEALFLDRVALLAVGHPTDTEVFPDEGLRSSPPAFRLFAVRDLRPPVSARDDHGHDVLGALAALDHTFVDDFATHRIRGYAEEHRLVLDLGPRTGEDAALLLTGWTDYAFSSDNVAASQAGLALAPPRLETETSPGVWETAVAEIGIPVGRPQTLVVPLHGRWKSPCRRVRIVTNMRIYWDQVQVGRFTAAPAAPVRLDPVAARLSERGFSAAVSPDGREPFAYDYEKVSLGSPWKELPGRYTRVGDVRELLLAVDDIFAISRPGDEIAVSFDASRLRPLPPGWKRTYLLYADGFSKEMDIHSASPDTLEPLPYHGMPTYPYAPPAAYPLTLERRAYLERYNTRVVRSPVPPIEVAARESGRDR